MHIYNLCRQCEDTRDLKLRFALSAPSLPQSVDLRPNCPAVFDQGDLGSCTANAGVAARMMLDDISQMLSRLFLYYEERSLEGTVGEDAGASMRSICKALRRFGVCTEQLWPYIVSRFADAPSPAAVAEALTYRIGAYRALDCCGPREQLAHIRQYIAAHRQPVLSGLDVYASFESAAAARSGVIPVPDPATQQYLGGHAVLLVGYDNAKQQLIFRNSWGSRWGDAGYGYLPYDFVLDGYAFDFWVLEKVPD